MAAASAALWTHKRVALARGQLQRHEGHGAVRGRANGAGGVEVLGRVQCELSGVFAGKRRQEEGKAFHFGLFRRIAKRKSPNPVQKLLRKLPRNPDPRSARVHHCAAGSLRAAQPQAGLVHAHVPQPQLPATLRDEGKPGNLGFWIEVAGGGNSVFSPSLQPEALACMHATHWELNPPKVISPSESKSAGRANENTGSRMKPREAISCASERPPSALGNPEIQFPLLVQDKLKERREIPRPTMPSKAATNITNSTTSDGHFAAHEAQKTDAPAVGSLRQTRGWESCRKLSSSSLALLAFLLSPT